MASPIALHVTHVRILRDYRVWPKFSDHSEGEVDLAGGLDGDVFGPLKNPMLFRTLHVDKELGTIAWDNGTELAPEFLYEHLRIPA